MKIVGAVCPYFRIESVEGTPEEVLALFKFLSESATTGGAVAP